MKVVSLSICHAAEVNPIIIFLVGMSAQHSGQFTIQSE